MFSSMRCVCGGEPKLQRECSLLLRMSYSTCSRGPRGGGEGVLVSEDPLPKPVQTYLPVSALGPSVGSWGIPSFHLMFISIPFRAVPFLVSGTARA